MSRIRSSRSRCRSSGTGSCRLRSSRSWASRIRTRAACCWSCCSSPVSRSSSSSTQVTGRRPRRSKLIAPALACVLVCCGVLGVHYAFDPQRSGGSERAEVPAPGLAGEAGPTGRVLAVTARSYRALSSGVRTIFLPQVRYFRQLPCAVQDPGTLQDLDFGLYGASLRALSESCSGLHASRSAWAQKPLRSLSGAARSLLSLCHGARAPVSEPICRCPTRCSASGEVTALESAFFRSAIPRSSSFITSTNISRDRPCGSGTSNPPHWPIRKTFPRALGDNRSTSRTCHCSMVRTSSWSRSSSGVSCRALCPLKSRPRSRISSTEMGSAGRPTGAANPADRNLGSSAW